MIFTAASDPSSIQKKDQMGFSYAKLDPSSQGKGMSSTSGSSMESSSLQLDLDLGRKVGDEMIEGINQSSTSSSSLPMNSLQIQSRFEPGSLNANLAVISDTLEQEILVVFELPDGSIAEGKLQNVLRRSIDFPV